ncbi:MAG TPA: hypothetical protein G4O09_06345 [Dehalococcoidia bacterium]|nr:hypothetical protein [Dehalococcoidia bacterium]
MEWWQVLLILIAAVLIGGVIGILISYLILRFVRKRETTFLSDLVARFPKKVEPAPMAKAETTFSAPDLLAEVKHNQTIAAEPIDEKLSTFQTEVWDAHNYQLDKLPAELRDDLEQVYTDIRLANSLAWLSTEFSRRTPSLEENYTKLRRSINEKLDKIAAHLEQAESG